MFELLGTAGQSQDELKSSMTQKDRDGGLPFELVELLLSPAHHQTSLIPWLGESTYLIRSPGNISDQS